MSVVFKHFFTNPTGGNATRVWSALVHAETCCLDEPSTHLSGLSAASVWSWGRAVQSVWSWGRAVQSVWSRPLALEPCHPRCVCGSRGLVVRVLSTGIPGKPGMNEDSQWMRAGRWASRCRTQWIMRTPHDGVADGIGEMDGRASARSNGGDKWCALIVTEPKSKMGRSSSLNGHWVKSRRWR